MKLHHLILALLIAVFCFTLVPAQKSSASSKSELSAAEREELLKFRESVWRDFFAGNKTALEKALPENFIGIGWGAGEERTGGRADVLANAEGFAKAGGKLTRLAFPETKIQTYGSVSVIYTTYDLDLEINGKTETHKGHGTEFFVRENGKWIHPGWHLDNY